MIVSTIYKKFLTTTIMAKTKITSDEITVISTTFWTVNMKIITIF